MPIFRDNIQFLYNIIIIRVLGGLAYKGRPMWWRYGYPIEENFWRTDSHVSEFDSNRQTDRVRQTDWQSRETDEQTSKYYDADFHNQINHNQSTPIFITKWCNSMYSAINKLIVYYQLYDII